MDCGDDACTFGSEIDISATVKINKAFSDNSVSYKFCILAMGVVEVYCSDILDADSICNDFTNTDGNECGTAGTYTFSVQEKIPDSAGDYGSYLESFSYAISGKVHVYLEDLSTCNIQIATSTSGSSSSAFFVGISAVGVVALVAGSLFMKRRRVITGVDGEDKSAPFVEMTESSAKMAIV
mmetsp:Transcript_11024/g.13274  ORF Transcript_11024/g.13274 Transcript_11024/m.13274 type:complete len:181 (+) Transcript_11024:135-677(+)